MGKKDGNLCSRGARRRLILGARLVLGLSKHVEGILAEPVEAHTIVLAGGKMGRRYHIIGELSWAKKMEISARGGARRRLILETRLVLGLSKHVEVILAEPVEAHTIVLAQHPGSN